MNYISFRNLVPVLESKNDSKVIFEKTVNQGSEQMQAYAQQQTPNQRRIGAHRKDKEEAQQEH